MLTSAGIIGADASTIVDDFERSSLDHYDGRTSSASIVDESNVTPSAVSGSKLVEMTWTSNQIYSTTGLDNYYAKGDGTLEIYMYVEGGSGDEQFRPRYGLADSDSCYEIRLTSNNWDVLLYDNGFDSVLADADDASLSADTMHRFEITRDDGTLGGSDNDHTIRLYDNSTGAQLGSTLTFNDSTHSSADGHALRARNGDNETFYADYLNYS
jgi:hypothetical protein